MKLINKIKKADFSKKTDLFIAAELDSVETQNIINEMVMSLPKGHYKLHGREYGVNLVDTMWEVYGWMPSILVKESTILGLQACHPERIYASFTLGLDIIEVK